MLSRENNERLTRVGPGTPMGKLLREYWTPALLSTELPTPDCAPVRVMLLGERLVAIRDSNGNVGLFGEACPHRGASLYFGRSEDCGIRCIYHGWKFDITGACVDIPSEPSGTPAGEKVRALAYPCRERGGVVWTYMGQREPPPPLPMLAPNMDDTFAPADATLLENNWLQCLEGDIDSLHIPHLHAGNSARPQAPQTPAAPTPSRRNTSIEVAGTPAGFAFASCVSMGGWTRAEVGHFMFPFYANLPYGPLGCHWVVARVPMDDHHTMTFGMWMRDARRPPRATTFGPEPAFLPNTTDWFGRFRLARNAANDFGLDRERAHRDRSSGIDGQGVQDAAITWSMGPIVDRTREHLGREDVAITQLRKRLLGAVREVETTGTAPVVDTPNAYRVKHGTVIVEDGSSWFDELSKRGGAGAED